jgi:hypothetical protein
MRNNGDFKIAFTYEDGLVAELDFKRHVEQMRGPIAEPLADEAFFGQAFIDHGVVTWPNGFDICPDVLRFWCENGRVCSDEETSAHLGSFATA